MTRAALIVIILCTLALLAWGGWLLHDAGHLSRAGLVALADRTGMWAPLLVIGAMVLAVVFGPIPTIPVSVASGVLFGGIPGFALAMFGALLGAWVSFHIARAVGQPVMERLFRGHAMFCPHCSTRALFWAVLGARLIPVVSFAAISYAAGLTAMRVTPFLLATAIGMTPGTVLYVAVGAAVRIDPVVAATGGVIAAVLLVSLPRLIERFNPLGLRRFMTRAQ